MRCNFKAIVVFLSLWINTLIAAQQVSIQMPRSHGYVGVPMELFVLYENVDEDTEPTLPDIDGFTIQKLLGEQTSSQTTIINGKVTSTSSRVFTFYLTPQREGTFILPALTFHAGGKTFQSKPKRIVVDQPPTGGSLKVAVTGTSHDVYLGQPIDLELQIFIEAFTDPQLGITLEPRDMIRTLRSDSNYGIFTEVIRDGSVQVQQVQGNNDAGIPTTFYVISVHTTTWPETTGSFEMSPITVLADYPVSLSRQRGFGLLGGSSLTIDQSHLISARAEMPDITVLQPPTAGRPEWFNGAVGNFDFNMVAEPTHVKVGEPITLTMRVTDRTVGPVNLDYLASPKLNHVPALTNAFRVPDEPLGGVVDGHTKTFTQTIRPRSDSVSEIPPLPMSSFDPESNTYRTVWTSPIPITVDPVATVTASNIVGGTNEELQRQTEPEQLKEVHGGILANYTGDALLRSQTISLTPVFMAAMVAPPLLFTCVLFSLGYRKRKRTPVIQRKEAFKQAFEALHRAKHMEGVDQAMLISSTLRSLLEEIGQQSSPTQDNILNQRTNAVLRRCDAVQFGGAADMTLVDDALIVTETLR